MIEHEPDQTIFERRDPLIGHTLDDRFRIDARIAAGGFGSIYRAEDLRSGQDIALKVLHANVAADPLLVARFRREAATLTSLRDPHTVTAYELGEAADGTLYIAMELLRGETLYEALRKQGGPLPWRRVAAIARAVCSSLAEAHERGIVHRDLKPANIHLQERDGRQDFVKVLDFGIAKVLHGSDFESSELTIAGQMIGTFDYMAPEQMLGGVVGAPCDLYTLGVVMYEMIAGRLPFADATSPTQLLAMLLTTAPPPLTERAPVPPALDRIVMRCLEREPQERYQSAAELARALDLVLAGGAHDEATRTAAARPLDHEDLTRVGHRAAEARAASASAPAAPTPHSTPARGVAAPRPTPARGVAAPRPTPARGVAAPWPTPPRAAQLRPAITPVHPLEPISEVRAQGSQPVIMPAGHGASHVADPRTPRPAFAAHAPAPPYPAAHAPAPPYPAAHAAVPPYPAYPAAPAAYPAAPAAYPAAPAAYPAAPAAYPVAPAAYPAAPAAYPQHVDPRAPYAISDGRGSQPYVDPRAPYAIFDGRGSQPYVDPRAPYAISDGRGSQPYVDARAPYAISDGARLAAVRRPAGRPARARAWPRLAAAAPDAASPRRRRIRRRPRRRRAPHRVVARARPGLRARDRRRETALTPPPAGAPITVVGLTAAAGREHIAREDDAGRTCRSPIRSRTSETVMAPWHLALGALDELEPSLELEPDDRLALHLSSSNEWSEQPPLRIAMVQPGRQIELHPLHAPARALPLPRPMAPLDDLWLLVRTTTRRYWFEIPYGMCGSSEEHGDVPQSGPPRPPPGAMLDDAVIPWRSIRFSLGRPGGWQLELICSSARPGQLELEARRPEAGPPPELELTAAGRAVELLDPWHTAEEEGEVLHVARYAVAPPAGASVLRGYLSLIIGGAASLELALPSSLTDPLHRSAARQRFGRGG